MALEHEENFGFTVNPKKCIGHVYNRLSDEPIRTIRGCRTIQDVSNKFFNKSNICMINQHGDHFNTGESVNDIVDILNNKFNKF